MTLDELSLPIVRAAIEAVNSRNRQAWLALFAADATLTDDGSPHDVQQWADSELFGQYHCRINAIDRKENNGTLIHSDFHSERWGDLKTFWKFTLENDKITRLDVGQED